MPYPMHGRQKVGNTKKLANNNATFSKVFLTHTKSFKVLQPVWGSVNKSNSRAKEYHFVERVKD